MSGASIRHGCFYELYEVFACNVSKHMRALSHADVTALVCILRGKIVRLGPEVSKNNGNRAAGVF